ncbi:MAG: hypothetical protein KDE57_03605, partial [Calditrichaeota bacterium]|nr:hypothetical protein [Calditrichota bacterium]
YTLSSHRCDAKSNCRKHDRRQFQMCTAILYYSLHFRNFVMQTIDSVAVVCHTIPSGTTLRIGG